MLFFLHFYMCQCLTFYHLKPLNFGQPFTDSRSILPHSNLMKCCLLYKIMSANDNVMMVKTVLVNFALKFKIIEIPDHLLCISCVMYQDVKMVLQRHANLELCTQTTDIVFHIFTNTSRRIALEANTKTEGLPESVVFYLSLYCLLALRTELWWLNWGRSSIYVFCSSCKAHSPSGGNKSFIDYYTKTFTMGCDQHKQPSLLICNTLIHLSSCAKSK